jgi:hypothetical protein
MDGIAGVEQLKQRKAKAARHTVGIGTEVIDPLIAIVPILCQYW